MKLLVASLVTLLGAPASSWADDLPLWELGIGLAGVSVPDYGGSDQRQHHVLPIPYVVYRGKHVQADRDGIHLLGASRFEIDFSWDAGPPVSSSDNQAREGMSDLLPFVEVGPAVNVVLLADGRRSRALKLRLTARASIASDLLNWEWLGFTAAPELAFQAKERDWKVTASVGPMVSTEGVHAYAYEVDARDATMDRVAYDARGGFGGVRTLVRGGWRSGPLWVGAFARYDNLTGAVFADSPLVRSKHAFAFGTAVAWVFARSKRRAQH